MGSAESTKKNILINSKDYNLIKQEVSAINPTLEELFHSKCDENNCMNEYVFFNLFKMPKIEELENQFKRLFFHKSGKGKPYKISYTQFRYFYYLFIKGEEIFETKIKFLSELFFGENKSVDPLIFHNNLLLYCPIIEDVKFFYSKDFQLNCRDKKKELFVKSNFVKYCLELTRNKQDITYDNQMVRTDTDIINMNNNLSTVEWKMNEYNMQNQKYEIQALNKHRPSISTVSRVSKFIPSLKDLQVQLKKIDVVQQNKEGFITHLNFPSEIEEDIILRYIELFKQEEMLRNSLKNTDEKSMLFMYNRFLNLFGVKQPKLMSKVNNCFNEKYVYVCDCSNCNGKKTYNKLGERTATEKELEEMEASYKEFEKKTKNKKVHISDLKKLFKEFKIHEKFSDILGKFLEKEYQSTVVEFKAFKRILSIFRGAINEDNKKQILFYLCDPKKQKIKLASIKDIFKPEEYERIENENNKEITIQDFSKINAEYFIEDIFIAFDKINLIPFLKFNIIPKERAQIRECFNFFEINFLEYEEQLMKWCNKYNSFNAIEVKFINEFLDYINLDNNVSQKPQLTYNHIGKTHQNGVMSLKLNCTNKNDFYIIPSYLFEYLHKWLGTQDTMQIPLKKIQLKENAIQNEERLNKIGYLYTENKHSFLIQYSPIFCKLITFNEIVENIRSERRKKGSVDYNVNINALYNEINKMLITFRSSLQKKENNKQELICELDWTLSGAKIYEKLYNMILPVVQKEISTIRQIHNIKDPELFKQASLRSIKFYYFVHDEIKELKDLTKGDMITDEIIPLTDVLILVDYKKPLPISKAYTYDLIQNDETSERIISFGSSNSIMTNSFLAEPSSLMSEDKYIPELFNNPNISIINPIGEENEETIITLANIGNSCYINVILQMLLNSPIIKTVIYDNQNKVKDLINKAKSNKNNNNNNNNNNDTTMEILFKMLNIKWNSKKVRTTIPKNLLEQFRKKCHKINKNIVSTDKEGDANEFLLFLLETLSSELKFNQNKNSQFPSLSDDKLKYVNDEYCNRISNLYYSEHIKNEASYILPIFTFQTKKILQCEKCMNQKMLFEINHDWFLSVEPSNIITLNICLNRLPFCYKVYYESINEEFKTYNTITQPDKPLIYNLISYYCSRINKGESEIFINDHLSIEFSIKVDKTKTIGWLINFIKNIAILELERDDNNNDNDDDNVQYEQKENVMITRKKENKFTSFLVWGWNQSPQFYLPEMLIQSCFENEARVFVDEILNINGIRKIKESYCHNGIDDVFISFSYFTTDENELNKFDSIKNNYSEVFGLGSSEVNYNRINNENAKQNYNDNDSDNEEEINTSSKININNPHNNNQMVLNLLNDLKPNVSKTNNSSLYTFYLSQSVLKGYEIIKSSSLFNKNNEHIISFDSLFTRDNKKFSNDFQSLLLNNNQTHEYLIEIVHCYQSQLKHYFFEPFQKYKIQFKPSFLIVTSNNKDSITPIMLYDYIWEKYRKNLQTIKDIKKDQLWWLRSNKQLDRYRFCYPFCIKIIKTESKNKPNTSCAYCYWYQFCSGCILNPFNVEPINLDPDVAIEVEWCNEIVDLCYRKTNVICSLKCMLTENEGKWELTAEKETNNVNHKNEVKIEETLENLITFNTKEEKLIDVKCSYCNEQDCITQQIDIHRAPELLVINFMRFRYGYDSKKINIFIKYPINGLIINETSSGKNIEYNLYCVINHIGNTNQGHYTCTIRTSNSKWITYNDLINEEVKEEDVISPNAYILVYTRKKSKILNNSVTQLIDYLIDDDSNFNSKMFFENEPVVVDQHKQVYFVKDVGNGRGEVGDEDGIYEVDLNKVQRCLVVKNKQNEDDENDLSKSHVNMKTGDNKLGHNKQRTYSMFENNPEDGDNGWDESVCTLF